MFPPVLEKLLYRKEAELFFEAAAVSFSHICENDTPKLHFEIVISGVFYNHRQPFSGLA